MLLCNNFSVLSVNEVVFLFVCSTISAVELLDTGKTEIVCVSVPKELSRKIHQKLWLSFELTV